MMSIPAVPSVDWTLLWPVMTVMLTGIVGLTIEMIRPRQNNNMIVGVSLVGLAIAIFQLANQIGLPEATTFNDLISRDHFGTVLQILMLGACGLCFLFSEPYLRERHVPFAEFYPLALWSAAGGMLVVSTDSLIMLFIGVEVLSIALYCLAGLCREDQRSEESALKYFLLGSLASAFMLYGMAFLYGATGLLSLRALEVVPVNESMQMIGLGFILVGLGFKASLFPFHVWTPDVYQGAPSNVSAFMASVSKIAAFGALARLLVAADLIQEFWTPLVFWMAILTMTIGNLGALRSRDIKRTLGFSSVAHAGYLLVALLAHLEMPIAVPLDALLFYLAVYSVATIGSFAVISLAAKNGREDSREFALNGLWKKNPFAAGTLAVFMVSLIGMPFTGGFIGKFMIFQGALQAGLQPLAIVLAANSAISVFYYLGIIKATFVEAEEPTGGHFSQGTLGLNIACGICALLVLGAFFAGDLATGSVTEPLVTPTIVQR
ncbi:MAG: NADH-quinone oxidoreductase subunit N [Fimbriimonadaceae bacterium]|nr:NADH-quinone oxidoreductase subunit N [Fimbriimonadaceae bacterium]